MAELAELQNIDTSILDTIKSDQGGKLFETAQKEYPYLAGKDVAYIYTPNKDRRYLEFYSPEETGTPEAPRPSQLPMGKVGIQVFNPQTRPIDILGDYVSHYAVKQDPQLMEMYQQFSQNIPQETYQKRLNETIQNLQEEIQSTSDPKQKQMLMQELQSVQSKPKEWWERAGLPEYFRGYPFKQWGTDEQAKAMYTPQLLETLDKVRSYLGVK
jgi:hypothetical protein